MKPIISRREVLVGSAALTVTGISSRALGSQTAAGTTIASNRRALSKSDRKVRLITPSDSEFTRVMNDRFPGLLDDPTFRTLLPAAAIVRHLKGPALVAQSIRWTLNTPSGGYSTHLAQFSRPSTDLHSVDKGPKASATRAILSLGESMLVTPLYSIRESAFKGTELIDWNTLVGKKPIHRFLAKELVSATEIHVEIDSGIFTDRAIAGTDAGKLAKRLQFMKRGEEHVARALIIRHAQGRSDHGIKKFLKARATSFWLTDMKRNKRIFATAQKHHASYLLKLFNQTGRAAAIEAASHALNEQSYKVHRASA